MSSSSRRWRFVDNEATVRDRRVVEVEVVQAEGFLLPSGEAVSGLHVKARYPLLADRRWSTATIVDPPSDAGDRAAELAALLLLRQK